MLDLYLVDESAPGRKLYAGLEIKGRSGRVAVSEVFERLGLARIKESLAYIHHYLRPEHVEGFKEAVESGELVRFGSVTGKVTRGGGAEDGLLKIVDEAGATEFVAGTLKGRWLYKVVTAAGRILRKF